MNKKKKATRLKHRKNKERMKNIISASRLKAKPKKLEAPKEVESAVQATEEIKKPTAAKKAPSKNAATKKKAAAKKTTTKKPVAKKKAPKKKAQTKKAATKKKAE